jgi:hypothetical protein
VKLDVDARFLEEFRRFALRFSCEDCEHFDAPVERCSFAYPAEPRREHLRHLTLELCKSFELG